MLNYPHGVHLCVTVGTVSRTVHEFLDGIDEEVVSVSCEREAVLRANQRNNLRARPHGTTITKIHP